MPDHEVHVWRASLDPSGEERDRLEQTLSSDEQARTLRFQFESDRRHFTAARGILRDILARYLDREPSQIKFLYGPSGKPALSREHGEEDFRFNVSHSHGLALYAVSRRREVGVDLERIGKRVGEDKVAERFFSRREVSSLRALSPGLQLAAFFNCWTRKEAYIKARGEGLGIPLDSFEVTLAPGEPAALSEGASGWSLEALAPAAEFAAAVVAQGEGWHLTLWQWQPGRRRPRRRT